MLAVQTTTNQIQYLHCFKMPASLMVCLQELKMIMILENVVVARMMLECRVNRGSMITGSSVHNQRVDRLHRDVTSGVLKSYIDDFNLIKTSCLLHLVNEVYLLPLHLVFLREININ